MVQTPKKLVIYLITCVNYNDLPRPIRECVNKLNLKH